MTTRAMIRANARLTIRLLPLSSLMVTECETRHPERLLHYMRLMTAHPDDHAGVVSVQPCGGHYALLDGHHRYCAAIMTGRRELLCLVVDETGAAQ